MKKIAVLVLTVLAITRFAATPAARGGVPFHGSVQAVETDQFDFPNILVDGHGSGNATLLGRFTFTFAVAVNVVTASGPASIQFVAANGDTLQAEGSGQATDTGSGVTIVETYTITSGTGRFAEASGRVTVERQLNQATGVSTGSFDGSITLR